MAATADVVVEAREHTINLCSLARVTHICTESSATEQVPAETRESSCKGRMRNVLLLIGFTCIISCFVFASMGYIQLKSCPANTQDPSTNNCKENSNQFKQAQNYRLSAALLFILGICIIVAFIWMVKKDSRGQHYVIRRDVVVSNVTEEGLLKTPAPDLPHPRSQLHRLVYDEVSETRTSQNDLPQYESALKLNNQAKECKLCDTTSNEVINVRGVTMESVSVQVDEDDLNPPPSYTQALLHQSEDEEQSSDGQSHEELDNG